MCVMNFEKKLLDVKFSYKHLIYPNLLQFMGIYGTRVTKLSKGRIIMTCYNDVLMNISDTFSQVYDISGIS